MVGYVGCNIGQLSKVMVFLCGFCYDFLSALFQGFGRTRRWFVSFNFRMLRFYFLLSSDGHGEGTDLKTCAGKLPNNWSTETQVLLLTQCHTDGPENRFLT